PRDGPLEWVLQVSRGPAHGIVGPNGDVLNLPGATVVARQVSTETAGVDHIGIVGADGDVAALTTSHRVPISRRDGRVIGPTGNAQGIDVLLGTIDPVGDLIVGRHVIELS